MGRPTLVVHVRQRPAAEAGPAYIGAAPHVGFVVSKAVGGAVVRNRVKRRLRELSRPLVTAMPDHWSVVVRALPSVAAEPGRLATDLSDAWASALQKAGVS